MDDYTEDEYTEAPDTYLDRVDGHWYVIRYDRTLPQIHAADCATCTYTPAHQGHDSVRGEWCPGREVAR